MWGSLPILTLLLSSAVWSTEAAIGKINARCKARADVLFILDGSESVKLANFAKVKKFAADLTSNFDIGPNNVQVGALLFSSRMDFALEFDEAQTNSDVSLAISTLPYLREGTQTAKALKFARKTCFQSSSGARADATKIAVVVTDGESAYPDETATQAKLLKGSGVTTLAIGVGPEVNDTELVAIATSQSMVFKVDNFNVLDAILENVVDWTCPTPDYGEPCTDECLSNYACINGICQCKSDQLYDEPNARCIPKPIVKPKTCISADGSCKGRPDGNYEICYPGCQSGYYIACSNEELYKMPCALGWYIDVSNSRFLAKMVYVGKTDTCELRADYCPRDPLDYKEPTPEPPAPRDECSEDSELCAGQANTVCVDLDRGYQCRCRSGYARDKSGACLPEAEAEQCVSDSCENFPNGNYPACAPRCQRGVFVTCVHGYLYERNCSLSWYVDNNNKRFLAKMVYVPESDSCEREAAYCPRDPADYCEVEPEPDVDECAAEVNPCGANEVCVNTDPGYQCNCRNGYLRIDGVCRESVAASCHGKADVLLVMDGSGSIGNINFGIMLNFLASLTDKFNVGNGTTQIGALKFSDSCNKEFDFDDYLDSASLKQGLLNINYPGDGTRTQLALNDARTFFTSANGHRKGAGKIVVVITDGCSSDSAATLAAAEALKAEGVTVVSIGIGEVNQNELYAMASSPEKVFKVQDFHVLSVIEDEVAKQACAVPTCISTSCKGMPDGNYPACDPKCQQGLYFSCVNEYAYEMPCPLGWYVDDDNNRYLAPMVYVPETDSCELEADYCPRDPTVYETEAPVPAATTPPPPPEEKCKDEADILFIVDASESIGSGNYSLMKDFLGKFTRNFDMAANGIRFSSLVFSSQVVDSFGFNDYTNNNDVVKAINNLPYLREGTDTMDALVRAAQYSFTSKNGARSGVSKIAVVLTDGQSADIVATAKAADNLRSKGVTVLVIGVGSQINMNELLLIASPGRVFKVDNFRVLADIENELLTRTCVSPPKPSSTNVPKCLSCELSCDGRPDGDYPACSPTCTTGIYYSCVAGYRFIRPCALGWYIQGDDDSATTARTVYDPETGRCEHETKYCPRTDMALPVS